MVRLAGVLLLKGFPLLGYLELFVGNLEGHPKKVLMGGIVSGDFIGIMTEDLPALSSDC